MKEQVDLIGRRQIIHADLNSFYANVECLYRPQIRSRPVAVCGDAQNRHGIILAKNEPAKKFKIKTGEAIWQAQNKCPDLILIDADFSKYLLYSRRVRAIFADYSDRIEPFGLDEAWLDVTGSRQLWGEASALADQIRRRTKIELGLTCSIGVSFNKIFAKLGSDYRKPDATTILTPENYRRIVFPLPVQALLYVGPSTKKKLNRVGIFTIGSLAGLSAAAARQLLGRWGEILWLFANGLDLSPVRRATEQDLIKSIGNSTTTPRDLLNAEDVRLTMTVLCESVAQRLREQGLRCRTVQISIRDSHLVTIERQHRLNQATDLARVLIDQAMSLFTAHWTWDRPVRSLGVRGCDLVGAGRREQLSLFCDDSRTADWQVIEETMDAIRNRFGHFSIGRGLLLKDRELTRFNPKGEHIIHPISYRPV